MERRVSDRERKMVGRIGENEACAYLASRGQTVLDRNWRSGHLEIDIVTMDGEGIHFVEVKTRRPPVQDPPKDSVNFPKQKRLTQAAARYLRQKDGGRWAGMEISFDVVTVVFDPQGVRMEYIPRAFIPVFFGR